MNRNFIVDEEIKLLAETDFLNTKVYAGALEKMIRDAPVKKPFTIGLFGEWGSGKSSIVKTVRESLEADKQIKTKFVLFDAWKYSEDAFRRSFIVSLSKDLKVELDKRQFNLYENRTEKIKDFNIKVSPITWLSLIAILLVMIGLYLGVPWVNKHITALASLAALFLSTSTIYVVLKPLFKKEILGKVFEQIQDLLLSKYDEERPLLFSPEQFAKAFEYIVDKTKAEVNRLVIVIDNIDRCEKRYATELLSTVKGFLESRENVLFVLPVDEGALKRHIRSSFNADDKEADEFLRKFFSVTLKIKPFHSTEIYDFAKKINQKYQLDFSDYTIDLVSKEFASNPRRIIQLFNNLSAELECFNDVNFAKKHETAICKLLIMREEFTEFYHQITKNPYLLGAADPNRMKSNPRLDNFLNKTRVITDGISIHDLNTILSNSIVFDSLPTDIHEAIEAAQLEAVVKFIGNDKGKLSIIIEYLIKQLNLYHDRQVIGSSFINYLTILIGLDKQYTLSDVVNLRVEEILKPELNPLTMNWNDLDLLATYGWNMSGRHRSYITSFIIQRLNDELRTSPPDNKWVNTMKLVIEKYDPLTMKQLANAYFHLYNSNSKLLPASTLAKEQVGVLVQDSLCNVIITKMTALSDSDSYYLDLKYLLEKKQQSVDITVNVVKRIKEIYPNPPGRTTVEVTNMMQGINGLLSPMKTVGIAAVQELNQLYNNAVTDRKIPHQNPVYAQSRQHDTMLSYVTDIIGGSGNIDELLTFCFNIYRLALINVTPLLQKLRNAGKFQTEIDNGLFDLAQQGIDLTSLNSYIINTANYTMTNLKLMKQVFVSKNKGEYVESDEAVRTKMRSMLNLIVARKEQAPILDAFFDDLSDDGRVKSILGQLIAEQSKANILLMPKNLQALALDQLFQGEGLFDFPEKQDFLLLISETGTKEHVTKLVDYLLAKLQQPAQFNDAITVIKAIQNISKADAERLVSELQNKAAKDNDNTEISGLLKELKDLAE